MYKLHILLKSLYKLHQLYLNICNVINVFQCYDCFARCVQIFIQTMINAEESMCHWCIDGAGIP